MIYIFGAGAHGRVISHLMRHYKIGGFSDLSNHGTEVNGFPVLGNDDGVLSTYRGSYILGMGWRFMKIRQRLIEEAKQPRWVPHGPYIHPSAIVDSSAKIGVGTIIFPGVIVNPHAIIGEHCVLNTGCIIEHNNVIGSNTFIAPGVVTGGTAKIGSNTFIGIGSKIRDCITIGSNMFIRAGSLILQNVIDDTHYGYKGK